MTRVKICGITNRDDAEAAVEAGADALGFNFYRESPRSIRPEVAARIIAELPPFVVPVGVFVNESPRAIERLAREIGLRAVELHGDESPATIALLAPLPVIKAFQVGPDFRPMMLRRFTADAFLLDGFRAGRRGGTGRAFDWSVARVSARYGRVIVAGGLTPQNVERAIAEARPYAVDVASGVERAPGRKNHHAVRAFIAAVRRADRKWKRE